MSAQENSAPVGPGPGGPAGPPPTTEVVAAGVASKSGQSYVKLFFKNPAMIVATVIVALLLLFTFIGELIVPYGINEVDVAAALQGPSAQHWFGTDDLGRDIMSRVLVATRTSMIVSVVSVSISLVAGVFLGLIAGYFRGWIDTVIMRSADVLFAFPVMLLAIAIVAILGPGRNTAMVAIAIVYTPIFARITRASVLSVREELFVEAATAMGSGSTRIILRHVLPNVTSPIIVQTSLSLAFAILSEAALSFLGLGVQPPQPSWGRMLFDGKAFIDMAWWMSVFPGLAIFLTVLAFNLFGDGLRDILDPKQRSMLQQAAAPRRKRKARAEG